MKKWLAVLVIFIVIVMVAVACHRGGGEDSNPLPSSGSDIPVPIPGPGPSPGTPPIVFPTAQQAAQGTATLSGALAMADAQFNVAVALGAGSTPPGFAPGFSGSSGNISNIDPTLAALVGQMAKFARAASIQKIVKKARAMKAMRANTVSTTITTDACPGGGTVDISGQNTFDEITNPQVESNYDITFTGCKDDAVFTQMDGKIHLDDSQRVADPNDPLADEHISRMVTTGLALQEFNAATFATADLVKTSVMNGSFVNDDHVTTANRVSTGTFVVTAAVTGKTDTFTFNGLAEDITKTQNADGSATTSTNTNGTFKASSASGGVTTLQVSLAIGLVKQSNAASDGTRTEKINGSVDISYDGSPSTVTAGCLAGKLTVSTADTTPRVFSTASPACPVSGALTLNNSTVSYGNPIQVAVDNGTPTPFADCAALDASGGVCKF